MAKYIVDGTAFSHSQVKSKIWLCEKLEELCSSYAPPEGFTVWLYGGWYGVSAFLLNVRNILPLYRVRNFDMDQDAVTISDMINETKVYENWGFKGFVRDCNAINPLGDLSEVASAKPHIIINTAVEHFEDDNWWTLIPAKTFVALQASTMPHDDHIRSIESLEELKKKFRNAEWIFEGEKSFAYPGEVPFKRFMLIGRKNE